MMQAQVLSSVVYRVVKRRIGKPTQYKDMKTYAFDLAYTGNESVAVSVVHPKCHSEPECRLDRQIDGGICWYSTGGSYLCYHDQMFKGGGLITANNGYMGYAQWGEVPKERNFWQYDLKKYTSNGIAPSKSGGILLCLWNCAMGESSQGVVLKLDDDDIHLKIESDKNRKLFTCPTYVTENGNEHICVSDVGAVVVTDGGGMFRFRYKGRPGDPHFDPYGICCDSRCNIIMADTKNNKIHMIDQDGDFLYYIQYGGMKMPRALCIDENDKLYVGERNCDDIKVLSRD